MTTTYAVAAWNTHRAACPEYLYDLAVRLEHLDRHPYVLLCNRRECPHPLYADTPAALVGRLNLEDLEVQAAAALFNAASSGQWHHLAPTGTPTQGRLI